MNFHSARSLASRTLVTLLAWAAAAPAAPVEDAKKPAAEAAPAAGSAPGPQHIPVPALSTAFPQKPGPSELPEQRELPPVLRSKSDGPILAASEWPARRAEMRRVIEDYLTGHAPAPPGNVQGKELEARDLQKGKVHYRRVRLTFGPESKLGLDIGVFTPAGPGPFPVLVDPAGTPPGASPLPRLPQGPGQGQGGDPLLAVGSGPTPAKAPAPRALDAETIARENPALARGYAYVVFDHNDCGEDTTLRESDGSWSFRRTRFFPAYPGYDWGLLRAWAWGASRVVDYLITSPDIDPRKVVLTGFSRTGKSALIAGAFDDHIAVTAPVATGGGGVGVFRGSGAGRGGKEGLDVMLKKYPNWFSPALLPFSGHTDRLPFDQHWLIALIAPRAFIALEGETDPVSLASAVRESMAGAAPVYALHDASASLGVNFAKRAHSVTANDYSALFDFADAAFARPRPAGGPGGRRPGSRAAATAAAAAAAAGTPAAGTAAAAASTPAASPAAASTGTSAAGGAPAGNTPAAPPAANTPPSRRFDRFPPAAFRLDAEPRRAQRITLWNGRDLKGWTFFSGDPKVEAKTAVTVRGGALRFDTPARAYIATEQTFADYHLHVEWRWPQGSTENANSGVMLHMHGPDAIWPLCFECQLKATNAGQVVGMGVDIPAAPLLDKRKRAPRFATQSELPFGAWNQYEIYCRGDRIEAYVNGVLQNNVDQLPVKAGKIALQMEGFPIEFRNVWLEPLAASGSPPPAAAAAPKAPATPAPAVATSPR